MLLDEANTRVMFSNLEHYVDSFKIAIAFLDRESSKRVV